MLHESHDGDIEAIRATPGFVGGLLRVYDRMLGWNLRHPLLASSGALLLFFGAIGIVTQSAMAPTFGPPLLNLKFFPDDVSVIKVAIRVPDNGTRNDTEHMLNEIGRDIVNLGSSKIESVSGIVGMSVDASYRPLFGERRGFLFAALPRIDEQDIDDPRQFISELRDQLETNYGDLLSELEVEANRDGPPTGMPVAIRVQGVDDRTVTRAADDLYAWLQSQMVDGGPLADVTNLVHSSHESDRVLKFSFDFAQLNQHQLTLLQAQQAVSGLFDGRYVGELQLTNEELPIRLQMSDAIADTPGRVASIPLQRSLQVPPSYFGCRQRHRRSGEYPFIPPRFCPSHRYYRWFGRQYNAEPGSGATHRQCLVAGTRRSVPRRHGGLWRRSRKHRAVLPKPGHGFFNRLAADLRHFSRAIQKLPPTFCYYYQRWF